MMSIQGAARRNCCLLLFMTMFLAPAWAMEPPADGPSVTVAFPRDIPPGYSLDDKGRPQGYAHDVMEELAKRAGLQVNYLVVDSLSEALAAVRQGKAQVIPSLVITPARQELLRFSSPMIDSSAVVFVRSNQKIDEPIDYRSLRMGSVAQSSAEEALLVKIDAPLQVYLSHLEALMALLGEDIDALVAQDKQIIALARRAHVESLVKIVGEPISRTYRSVAVVKDRQDLFQLLDWAVERLVLSPDYPRIYAKWYGEPTPFWTVARIIWTMSGVLVLAVLGMAAWRFTSLRRINAQLRQTALERGRAQALANANAEELQLILDTVPASIWFKDGQNRFLRVNREAARQIGRTQAEIEGRHARELFPRWLADKYHQDDLAVMAHLRPMLDIEEQYVRADGSMGWLSTHKVPWQDKEDERFGVIALSVDITRRKEAEQRLRESEEQFRQMAEMLPTAICQADLDAKITFLNGAGKQLFGLSAEDLEQGVHIPQLIHPAERPLAKTRLRAMLGGEKLPTREYTIVRKDGGELHALVAGGAVVRDGGPTGFLHTLLDLTERRAMEQALRQAKEGLEAKVVGRTAALAQANQLLREEIDRRRISQRELKNALSVLSATFQSTADGMEVVDNTGRMSFFNQKLCDMWSLPASITDAHDTDAALNFALPQLKEPQVLLDHVGRVRDVPDAGLAFTLELKDGRVFEVDSLPQRLGEKTIGRVWSFRDVTKRLAAERALRRSEKRYRDVVDNAQESIVVAQDGVVVFFNPQAQILTGLDRDVLQGRAWNEIIDGDDRPETSDKGKSPIDVAALGRVEFRIRDKNSDLKWVESNSVGIEWEGRPAILHFLGDITQRKEASLALQETLQTLSATLAASPVGIGFAKARTMLWANNAMHDILGYDDGEFKGQPARVLYADEDEYRRVGSLLYGAGPGEEPVSLDTRMRRKDGTVIDVFLQTRQIDPDDASRGLIAAITDISERKRSEEALLAYQKQLHRLINELSVVEERERRRIASDLHDGLGQDLALMRIKLATVLGSPGRPAKKWLMDILVMIDKALEDAKALTWDLSAPMLRELGLVPALGWLAEQNEAKFAIPTHLGLVGVPARLDQTMADSLFRITRELVMNAVKHSNCSRIKISLKFEERLLTLTVADDGVGFDSSQLDRHMDKGFGLFNLRGMIDSWGGKAAIDSRPGRGSEIIISVPLQALITGRIISDSAHHTGRRPPNNAGGA